MTDQTPFTTDRYIYLQLADRLERRIRNGEFGKSGKLPNGRELAAWYQVSITAVERSRTELQRRRLVVPVSGRGTFARPRSTSTEEE